ncbi:MAG: type II toxin-antitoxin system HicA family toxin [Verrucomicrobiaceae bacterium]|nr:type II toxin-antitoxin system HicA family toxin [Verrucomicrobiaceae bacterium]
MAKPKKPAEVVKLLRAYDSRFVIYTSRAKGSHRMIEHPNINGKRASIPLPFHKGKDVSAGVLNSIIRRFGLPKDFFG